MRIVITGITGYIGSNLARELLKKHEVYGVVRQPLNTQYIEDIKDKLVLLPYDGTPENLFFILKECRPELIYHLAAYYTPLHDANNIKQLLYSNVIFGSYLLEAMVSIKCKNIIYASSITEHYNNEEYNPCTFYAATKKAFSDILRYYVEEKNVKYGNIVIADTYGSMDKRNKILSLIKNKAITDKEIDLSSGLQDYAPVHIDDVVNAFIMAGEQLINKEWQNLSFQILPKDLFRLRDVVEKMVNINKLDIKLNWGKKKNLSRSIDKIVRIYPDVPNWEPKIKLEDGLKEI